jgi:hypothetical protein
MARVAVPSVASGSVIRVAPWIGVAPRSESGSLSHGVLAAALVFPTLRRVVRRTPEGPLLS